jgi:hypothetical protein
VKTSLATATVTALLLLAAPRARASEAVGRDGAPALDATREDAAMNLRVFAGGGNGLGGDGWLARRLRLEASVQSTFPPVRFALGDVALVIPITGDRHTFSGLRAGYQLQYIDGSGAYFQGSQLSHAPDVGYVFHFEADTGSTFQIDFGVEAVYRAQAVICCDHAPLATTSTGVRVAVMGELAMTPTWALYGHVGVRTADHLLEVKILPTLSAGLRARF